MFVVRRSLPQPDSPAGCSVSPSDTERTLETVDAEIYVLDHRGDLWLHTEGTDIDGCSDPAYFQVCSRTMARASPVFDRMLFGHFFEAARNKDEAGRWAVDLPEDSTWAIKVLLWVIHGHYEHLRLSHAANADFVPRLYELLVLADKYDCVHILRPWAAQWSHKMARQIGDPVANDSEQEKLLHTSWICYHLGDRVGFETVLTHLILKFPLGSHIQMEREGFMPCPLPPDLIHILDSNRLQLIQSVLAPLARNVGKLLRSRTKLVGLCQGLNHARGGPVEPQIRAACEEQLLCRAMRCLQPHGLWPIPDAATAALRGHSPAALSEIVSGLGTMAQGIRRGGGFVMPGNHAACGLVDMSWHPLRDQPPVYVAAGYRYRVSAALDEYFVRQADLMGISERGQGVVDAGDWVQFFV
ncbi:hypothetical protein Micbo1qcDRAFT_206207 [Microdochium bolleyi]|uniref:BTB domain-containing protein n=1 Tax=Microdochium bolleyi TaxID=196109 RepID=A0A136IYI7_9PEZI|nr:hypothetical protein Micbo1qcDRAFT_206207 [Microdochium bolleyi]